MVAPMDSVLGTRKMIHCPRSFYACSKQRGEKEEKKKGVGERNARNQCLLNRKRQGLWAQNYNSKFSKTIKKNKNREVEKAIKSININS